ncbi:hypothetical protein KIM67_02630 [Flagellimonas sp. 389]|uniref:DUF4175 family protein n=1 Tax=Flagellimonas sp. 389 TaxID=2835862 RepID=UPI001BD3F219|nr:hypothetical protein [Flagellimonas sp. 389]MBS9461292.1 hypothetical protein [Flagellimonas sp. 389]
MNSYHKILEKLNRFIKKYYTKQLIKGGLLFVTLGLLFWMAILSLEYVLWLSQEWRLALFSVFVLVELFLLYRFILMPLFYLFQIKNGISNKEASRLIGKHFPQVDDKLYNLLELSENQTASELLLASIEQKAESLGVVPFTEAINFKESYKYAKYVVIPLLLLGFIWLSGNIASFFNSHKRIVNYDLAFEQPAPFKFQVLNDKLEVLDNEPLVVTVSVVGDVKPENVYMVVNGEELLLKRSQGIYTQTFEAPVEESSFYLTANGWDSKSYTIKSYKTPVLVDFKMKLDFPNYLGRKNEEITGTGNAVVPEGTKISWQIEGDNVANISMVTLDTVQLFRKEGNSFTYKNNIYKNLAYELKTSNAHVRDFEKLAYTLDVIKDQSPTVKVEQILDSINPNQSFFTGQAADDYGLNQIRVVCYSSDDQENVQRVLLESPNTNVHQFYYTFPSGLDLQEGKNYKLFFEIVDNDGIRGGKVIKSQVFDATLLNDNELKSKELEFQNTVMDRMGETLDNYRKQQETLSKINTKQKEEKNLNFEDKNQIKDFLQKQEEQEMLMEKFSKQLNESLSKDDENSEMKKMLQERLERQEQEAKKNEKLLEELNKLADKINKEELKKKLDELGKSQSKGARNLEQILELTKRYYVTEKMAQLSRELDELSKEQEQLSETDGKANDNQEKLNEEFNKLSDELDELKNDNDDLKKPMQVGVSKKEQDAIKKDQKDALEELNNNEGENSEQSDSKNSNSKQKASQKQKSASQKMKEMSKSLQQSSMGGGGSSITEDAEMLRQILDNLITFSFKQEKLFEGTENANLDVSQFSKSVRDQKELRRLFEHVDDSLFALSLRRAELSEFVNEQITEVYYNIDKSLESIAESQVYQSASYQQYVINATNKLADFLANILDNMQQSMQSGQGNGQGSDFQLPDIIEGQESIQEKMGNSGKQSGKGQQGEQGEQQDGENGKGEDGEGEQEGKGKGKQGQAEGQGKDGNGEGEGKAEGKEGKNGTGGSNGTDEMGLSEIYEIYKEQQFLRQQLEKQLEDLINNSDKNLARKLIQQMEDFENDLLENGITQRTQNKVNTIQHELLKLKNATLKQGKKNERESSRVKRNFTNPIITKPELLKDYQNDIEILNRQALPLRQNYEEKVKRYFNND